MTNVVTADQGWRAVWVPHMAAHGLPPESVSVGDLELTPVVLWYVQPATQPSADDASLPPAGFGFAATKNGLAPCEVFKTFIGYLAPGDGDDQLARLLKDWQEEAVMGEPDQ